MGDPDEGRWTRSALRVFTSTLDEHEINQILELRATGWSAADSPAGRVRRQVQGEESSVWIWRASIPASDSPEKHIEHMLDVLGKRTAALQRLSEVAEMDIAIGHGLSERGMSGLAFSHAVLVRLGKLPVSLWLDLYDGEPDSSA